MRYHKGQHGGAHHEAPRNSDNALLNLNDVERIVYEQSLKPQNPQSPVQHQAYLQREHHR